MKTALIIGAAAIAVYAVWRFGAANSPAVSAGTGGSLAAGNAPYPASPPPPPFVTAPAAIQAALSKGWILSATPLASNLSAAQQKVFRDHGAVLIQGSAFTAGPNYPGKATGPSQTAAGTAAGSSFTAAGSGVAAVSGGLISAPQTGADFLTGSGGGSGG